MESSKNGEISSHPGSCDAREWIAENQAGRPVFNALSKRDDRHEIEIIGSNLRKMMEWIK